MSKMTDQEEQLIATAFRTFTEWLITVGRAITSADFASYRASAGDFANKLVRDIRTIQDSEED